MWKNKIINSKSAPLPPKKDALEHLELEGLRKAYISANEDPGQVEANNEWQSTIADGLSV